MLSEGYVSKREKLFTRLAVVVSVAIPVLVGILLFTAAPEVESSIDLTILPAFHATLNSITAVLLICSYLFIRRKMVKWHKAFNLLAVLCSVLFLVSYVVYHSLTESTPFGGEGAIRYVYYFVLLTHIVLAVVIVPLVLFTLLRALSGKFEKHRKIARWTLPIWLYVAITGVIVYLMISPYYGT